MFGIHKRRKVDGASEVDLDKLVTPFLDMSFQLMAFFLITFKPQPIEGQMAINLPKAEDAASASPKDPTISDPEVEPPNEFRVMVGSANGAIRNITVKGDQQPVPWEVGSRPSELQAYLSKRRVQQDDKNVVKIEAQDSLKYECLIQVMDACIAAGFKSVGFANPTKGDPTAGDAAPGN
jgi:biopolymer transport protein ExbD